ncbi:MAG TPA: zinc ribbon domain-containing protein [Vicinamibacteria bacterium]|nr:zinc ribbon domain-containing protein [Vicinamibacteria bacterium]
MDAKKKLIVQMARWTGVVLALAALMGAFALLLDLRDRRSFDEETRRLSRQRVEESRAYLADLAQRIVALPVDATLASEIESRYFEQRADGSLYVWAMDTKGDFAFGVPRSAFDKLNAIYDREVTPRLKEGVFLDRQTFLLGLIDDSDDMGAEAISGQARELVPLWRVDRGERDGSFVLSTPLKTAGGALGSLYLKWRPSGRQERHRDDDGFKAALAGAGVAGVLSFVFLWILLPTWVYVDARERGVRRAPLFAFLTVLSSLVGLVVYLIARPEDRRTLACPGCGREVNGGAFCPHCGRDLSRSFCPACRYPLQADWAYCPTCRTEIKAPAAGAPVPEAG